MVTPTATYLEVAARLSVALESKPRNERERTAIAGLDVRIEPLQAKLEKRQIDDLNEPFAHEPIACVRHEGVVAQTAGLLWLGHDVFDVDDTGELA